MPLDLALMMLRSFRIQQLLSHQTACPTEEINSYSSSQVLRGRPRGLFSAQLYFDAWEASGVREVLDLLKHLADNQVIKEPACICHTEITSNP